MTAGMVTESDGVLKPQKGKRGLAALGVLLSKNPR
jgi:hypothetical protein